MTTPLCDPAILDLEVLAAMYGDSSLNTALVALSGFYPAASGYIKEIEHSGLRHQLADLAIAAHSLKGICGLVGATAMAELSSRLEHAARNGNVEQLPQPLALIPVYWRELEQQLRQVLTLDGR